jgi:plasmid stabilization system protein ParE
MLDYNILYPAFRQLENIYDYYYDKQETLASRFLKENRDVINHIRKYPRTRQRFYKNFRSVSLYSFPVKAIYMLQKNKIIIYAYVSTKGSPKDLKTYLRSQQK